jgi:tetratricopeptide (TPR) repeat protein
MSHTDDLYTQILTDGPSPKTILHLLSILKKEGHLKRVIEESLKALNTYPNDIHIRRLLAQTYFEAGLLSQAEAELDKVSALIGDLTDTYRLQAQIYMKQKRKEEAARSLELYLAHRPDDQEALDFLATLTPQGEAPTHEPQPLIEEIPAEAEEPGIVGDASASEERPPEIATPTLAEIYFQQGQIDEAINTYKIIVAQDPEDESSKKRLEELKTMIADQSPLEEKGLDEVRKKKERMIAILESWLGNIREQFSAPSD